MKRPALRWLVVILVVTLIAVIFFRWTRSVDYYDDTVIPVPAERSKTPP